MGRKNSENCEDYNYSGSLVYQLSTRQKHIGRYKKKLLWRFNILPVCTLQPSTTLDLYKSHQDRKKKITTEWIAEII